MKLQTFGRHAMRAMLVLIVVGIFGSLTTLISGSGSGLAYLATILASGMLCAVIILVVLTSRRKRGYDASGAAGGGQPAPWEFSGVGWSVGEPPKYEQEAPADPSVEQQED